MMMDWMGKTTGESEAYIDEVRKASKKVAQHKPGYND